MNLQQAPAVILSMFLIAVIGVATFLALDGLDDNLACGPGDNVSTAACEDPTTAMNATNSITSGVGNIFDLAPTWGTLVGVGILLAIVAGFVVIGFVGYSAGKNRGYF